MFCYNKLIQLPFLLILIIYKYNNFFKDRTAYQLMCGQDRRRRFKIQHYTYELTYEKLLYFSPKALSLTFYEASINIYLHLKLKRMHSLHFYISGYTTPLIKYSPLKYTWMKKGTQLTGFCKQAGIKQEAREENDLSLSLTEG